MTAHSPEDIKKETRVYIFVFIALAALTLITVGISYLHLSTGPAVALALCGPWIIWKVPLTVGSAPASR